jgi:hypothetical protein
MSTVDQLLRYGKSKEFPAERDRQVEQVRWALCDIITQGATHVQLTDRRGNSQVVSAERAREILHSLPDTIKVVERGQFLLRVDMPPPSALDNDEDAGVASIQVPEVQNVVVEQAIQ